MIYSRLVGHYSFRQLMKYVFYQKSDINSLLEIMPSRKYYSLYSQGRHALFHILKNLIQQQDIRTIAVPAWCCSIVHAVIESLPLEKILLDIRPNDLKIDLDYFTMVSKHKKIDCILLICENGNLYNQAEIDFFKSKNIVTLLDYSLAARNLSAIDSLDADFELYSGGFSKPVSSFGLGIAMSNKYPLSKVEITNDFAFKTFMKVIIHIACQSKLIYALLRNFLPRDDSSQYNSHEDIRSSYRSISAFLFALQCFNLQKSTFVAFQDYLHKQLIAKGIPSTLDHANGALLTKVLVSKEIQLKHVEMHLQYASPIENVGRLCAFSGVKDLKDNYHSFSVSLAVAKYKKIVL